MRFTIVTLMCIMFVTAAHAEVGFEPYEYFGLRLGSTRTEATKALFASKKLGAYNTWSANFHGSVELMVSINHSGYDFVPLSLFFVNDRLIAIKVRSSTKYTRMCGFAEDDLNQKPSKVVENERTVFNVRRGLVVTVMRHGCVGEEGSGDVFYTASENDIPEYELGIYAHFRKFDPTLLKKK